MKYIYLVITKNQYGSAIQFALSSYDAAKAIAEQMTKDSQDGLTYKILEVRHIDAE